MMNDLHEAFSTPADNPLVVKLPMEMRNTEILTAYYRTDIEASRAIVPQPLEVLNDLVIAHIYHMNDADWFGNYYESALQIPVRLKGADIVGAYSPYLYLGSDGAVSSGREIYGQPKKIGEPKIEFRQDLIVGTVARNGIEILCVTLPYKQRRASFDDMRAYGDFRTNINLKIVPHIDGSDAIRQLTARDLTDIQLHECWMGDATVEIRPNAQAPIYKLPVREMLRGFYWRTTFTLPLGTVIHDYLQR
jgi:acetoacetate decarboxylase